MKIASIQNANNPKNPDIQITMSFHDAACISAANVAFLCGGDIRMANLLTDTIMICRNQADISACIKGLEICNEKIFGGDAAPNVELQKLLLQIRMERNLVLANQI